VTDEESQFVKNSLIRVFSNRISSSTAAAVPLPRWGRQREVRLAQGDTGVDAPLRIGERTVREAGPYGGFIAKAVAEFSRQEDDILAYK